MLKEVMPCITRKNGDLMIMILCLLLVAFPASLILYQSASDEE